MFEHLDDPSPPEPSGRTLGLVLQRSSRLRRRRSVSAASSIALVMLCLGVFIGYVVPRSSPQVNIDFTGQSEVAPGTAVAPSDLEEVVFVSQSQGFGLAVHTAQTALVESTDAGSSWRVVQGNLPVQYPAQILFSSATIGYLWGGEPSSDGALPLWVTSDGGKEWAEAPIGPVVSDVSAIGSDVWALVGGCFIGVSTSSNVCPVSVEVSHDNGRSWAPSASAPPVSETNVLSIGDQDVSLARMTVEHAYVLSFERGSADTSTGRILYTADGGQSWQPRVDPCPSYFDFGEQIAGSGTADLWMICASQASAGDQAKALYRSSDGGTSWRLAAAANAPVLSGNVVLRAAGGLPVGGYVSPYSLGHENLAVLTATSAWLFPDRGGVFETSDGGLTWAPVSGLEKAGLAAEGAGNVVFVDATHGWLCESGVGLWRTQDGVNWQRLGP